MPIANGDKTAFQKVDQATVRAIELKAPRYSKRDAQVSQGQLLSGQIFSAFRVSCALSTALSLTLHLL
jgi:hypothetical protein